MNRTSGVFEEESNETARRSGARPLLAGVEVREEDLEPQRGLHIAGMVFRVSAVIILLLALWQFTAWWLDRPPGGAGMAVLVSDTIRLIVVSFLLYGAAELADVIIKSHYEMRAGRILLARQTYMMRQMGIASGALPATGAVDAPTDRRGHPPDESVVPLRNPRPDA